jgi:hypothetical protein
MNSQLDESANHSQTLQRKTKTWRAVCRWQEKSVADQGTTPEVRSVTGDNKNQTRKQLKSNP